MGRKSPSQKTLEQKKKALADQEKLIADGERKFAQTEADTYSDLGHNVQRKFFDMKLTDRQMAGLPIHVGAPPGGWPVFDRRGRVIRPRAGKRSS